MERQRIWLSLSLFALGMICLGQENSFAKSNLVASYKGRVVVPVRIVTQPALPNPKCNELPQSCGLVTTSRLSRCQEFWYTHLQSESESACEEAATKDHNFSDYVICGRMYRNITQFAEMNWAKQFGNKVLAKGSCAPLAGLPMCDSASPVAAGGYCQCRPGSPVRVAGCEPNESGSNCFTMSIAHQCEG